MGIDIVVVVGRVGIKIVDGGVFCDFLVFMLVGGVCLGLVIGVLVV